MYLQESVLQSKLVDYLVTRGYPKDSLAGGWKIGQKYRADLVVIESVTNKPIAIFELKRIKNKETLNSAISQLLNYKKALEDEQVLLFLVFPNTDNSTFEFFLLDENKNAKINEESLKLVEQIPEYAVLKNSKISKEISKKEEQQKSTLDWFQVICWVLAAAILILLVLEFTEKIKLTPERLVLIGIIIGLIVVPVASKLKILGVEFERYKKEDTLKKEI